MTSTTDTEIPTQNNNIRHPSRNPVLKIPIIHRIFYYSASDVVKVEELSRVCIPFREALEVYGKPVFANFAERESKDFFRFFYELCEWAEDSWMIELMIDAWNESFGDQPNFLRAQDEWEYAATDLVRKEFAEKNKHKKSLLQQQKEEDEEAKKAAVAASSGDSSVDFFTCPAMARCYQEHGCTPLHVAARFDRYEIVQALVRKGANIYQKDVHRKNVIDTLLHHDSARSMLILLEEQRRRYYVNLVIKNKNQEEEEKEENSHITIEQKIQAFMDADRKLSAAMSTKRQQLQDEYKVLFAAEPEYPTQEFDAITRACEEHQKLEDEFMYRTFDLEAYLRVVIDESKIELNDEEKADWGFFVKRLHTELFSSSSSDDDDDNKEEEEEEEEEEDEKKNENENQGEEDDDNNGRTASTKFLVDSMVQFLQNCEREENAKRVAAGETDEDVDVEKEEWKASSSVAWESYQDW